MRTVVNLRVLGKQFSQLCNSAYFDKEFRTFLIKTNAAIQHVLEDTNRYPAPVVQAFESHLWKVRKFILGSRSSDAPYEVQFALRLALADWISGKPLVSSAAVDELNFFLNLEDTWSFIEGNFDQFETDGYRPLMIRIGSPDLYQHRPVFCTPLFHELGHFVDLQLKISETTMLLAPPGEPPPSLSMSKSDFEILVYRYRLEHFADLFAACYCSDGLNKSLQVIAGGHGNSDDHPATQVRVDTVEDFLNDNPNSVVDLFQNVLTVRGLPTLEKRFRIPEVTRHFDDALTYPIQNREELFGLFPASWDYLENQLVKRDAAWISENVTEFEVEKTINDLTEKSLRNFEVRQRWAETDAN